ncbi:MAG TPA: hypothetical protein VFG83_03525 [Kofleriaceae bacterium]|nr:hypothetical protein [Kofleriaceae bacterium]
MSRTASLTLLLLLFTGAGCGLIDSSVDDFNLKIDKQTLTVDTTSWMLSADDSLPSIDCSSMAGVCSAAAQDVCGAEFCFGECVAESGTCRLTVLVSLSETIDMKVEADGIEQVDDEPVIGVTVDRVYYNVVANTFEQVMMPPLSLYVAPRTVMSPGDPQAEMVGTIPAIAPGTTPQDVDVDFSGTGAEALRKHIGDWQTPFNIIVGGTVTLEAGDTIPHGKIQVDVYVDAHADAVR